MYISFNIFPRLSILLHNLYFCTFSFHFSFCLLKPPWSHYNKGKSVVVGLFLKMLFVVDDFLFYFFCCFLIKWCWQIRQISVPIFQMMCCLANKKYAIHFLTHGNSFLDTFKLPLLGSAKCLPSENKDHLCFTIQAKLIGVCVRREEGKTFATVR